LSERFEGGRCDAGLVVWGDAVSESGERERYRLTGLVRARRAPLRQRLLELYADCAGYPVDSVIQDAAALMYGDPSG
jgi:hypothetical protein